MKTITLTIGFALLLTSCGESINSTVNDAAQSQVDEITMQVAKDAEKQYEIALNGGDKVDIYTQASLVAAAYLQAKDSTNYKKWKDIQKKHAKEAGLPDM